MTVGFATALRNARAQAIIDAIDAGAQNGAIVLFTGPRPATGAAITTETQVAFCELSSPPATVSNGVISMNPISDDVSADADADIAWARIIDGDDNFVMDLSCGESGSGAEIIFNTVTARVGGVVQILSGAFTEGNA